MAIAHSISTALTKTANGQRRWLPLCAAVGPALFTAAWVTLGFMSTGYTIFDKHSDSYSPVAQPISGLGLGNTAAFMNTAFVVSGLLLLAGVIGILQSRDGTGRPLHATKRLWLLALTPAGMIIVGIFDLSKMMPHMLGFLFVSVAPIATFPMTGRVLRRTSCWRTLGTGLVIASPLTLTLTIAFFASFDPEAAGDNKGVAGLVQRILVTQVLSWF
jgi:hypothetical membrane protein